ncbi:hypothetical protein [Streptomyces sp. F001]|uniref:hypothetical protein n=1 Tax=Streptomyces sp. F001 TaxID=1510026 RepID=UPI0023EA61E4|nr:hypothetical protein [Streptomyces sp. F001]
MGRAVRASEPLPCWGEHHHASDSGSWPGEPPPVRAGDRVNPMTENWDRIGQLITTGADMAEAVRRCEELAERVRVVTSEG